MKEWLKKNWKYVLAAVILLLVVRSCRCQDMPAGVLGMDKVVRLPEDGTKWHVSVVGSDDRYREIVEWFNSEPKLRELKRQIHFHPISDKTGIQAYKVKGLPTVRLQDDRGRVIFEAVGDNIPATALGLYGAMARSIAGPCPWDRDPPVEPVDDGNGPPVVDVPKLDISWIDWRYLIVVAAVVAGIWYGRREQ